MYERRYWTLALQLISSRHRCPMLPIAVKAVKAFNIISPFCPIPSVRFITLSRPYDFPLSLLLDTWLFHGVCQSKSPDFCIFSLYALPCY